MQTFESSSVSEDYYKHTSLGVVALQVRDERWPAPCGSRGDKGTDELLCTYGKYPMAPAGDIACL